MPKIRKFIVTPSLPPKLQPLLEIARNLWWVWNPEAINLLRRVIKAHRSSTLFRRRCILSKLAEQLSPETMP